jgi:Site-specific recombinase XerD
MAAVHYLKASQRVVPKPLPQKGMIVPFQSKRVSATKAKVLTKEMYEALLEFVRMGKYPLRDTALVMLSCNVGLRAQEIAGLRWDRNVCDSMGRVSKVLFVSEDIGKRAVSREIPINDETYAALVALRKARPDDKFVIYPLFKVRRTRESAARLSFGEVGANTVVQYFRRLYADCFFVGCTSHSGRRTFITNLARRCNEAGASLRDVQLLAGHKSLATTEGYIEPSDQQHKLVNLVF